MSDVFWLWAESTWWPDAYAPQGHAYVMQLDAWQLDTLRFG